MKLKSPNVWFILSTVPVLVLDFVLGAWLARGMVWLSVVLLLLGLLAALALVRKFIVLPKPRNRYHRLQRGILSLPGNGQIRISAPYSGSGQPAVEREKTFSGYDQSDTGGKIRAGF